MCRSAHTVCLSSVLLRKSCGPISSAGAVDHPGSDTPADGGGCTPAWLGATTEVAEFLTTRWAKVTPGQVGMQS